jgi:hypothetical protein
LAFFWCFYFVGFTNLKQQAIEPDRAAISPARHRLKCCGFLDSTSVGVHPDAAGALKNGRQDMGDIPGRIECEGIYDGRRQSML